MDGRHDDSRARAAAVSGGYDRWSAQYDSDVNATRDLDAAVVRSAPLRLTGNSVLELGCGTGKNTIWLAERAQSVLALDFSAGMLQRARRRVPSATVRFMEHDILAPWPAESESVDVVIGNLVLEHVSTLEPVFAEAARVLRRGGQLFLCELHPYRQLLGSRAHFTEQASGDVVDVPAHVHTTSEFVNEGIAAGLHLAALGEWRAASDEEIAPPRLLSLLFERM